MFEFVEKPYSKNEILQIFDFSLKEWFLKKYLNFSEPQLYSIKIINSKKNLLLSSPTGTGKTLAVFLEIINNLIKKIRNNTLENTVYAIYITPLKALGNDIQKNLFEPLLELSKYFKSILNIRCMIRNGDTPLSERIKMNKFIPHILITTPESFGLLLSSNFRNFMKKTEYVIVDEIHSIVENKRGSHLSLNLERLNFISSKLIRIGLSATISPILEIANFLVGVNRICKIVQITQYKKKQLKVICPNPTLLDSDFTKSYHLFYDAITSIIEKYKTVLIFTNTRSGTERVVLDLKKILYSKYGENVDNFILAHHGSLGKEHRIYVENQLKLGLVKVVVTSTSLELGIDIGFIDSVIQIDSPKSIARCLQRVGRSGRGLQSKIIGNFICNSPDSILEVGMILKEGLLGKIDRIKIPQNSIDILIQNLIGMSFEQDWHVQSLFQIITRSYTYRNLNFKKFLEILYFLKGGVFFDKIYVSGKINFQEDIIKKKAYVRKNYFLNSGVIVQSRKIKVYFQKNLIGFIEEEFLEKMNIGDIFSLGGKSYFLKSIVGFRIWVLKTSKSPTIPSWYSEQLPLNYDISKKISEFRMNLFKVNSQKLITEYFQDIFSIKEINLISNYIKYQKNYLQKFTKIQTISKNDLIIEYFLKDSQYHLIFHSVVGRKINDCISRVIAYRISKNEKETISIKVTDNGFIIMSTKFKKFSSYWISTKNFHEDLKNSLKNTELMFRRFRDNLIRSFFFKENLLNQKWRLNILTKYFLNFLNKNKFNFIVLEETFREIIEDYLDLENSLEVINLFNNNKIHEINLDIPSLFTHSILLEGTYDVISFQEKKRILENYTSQIIKMK